MNTNQNLENELELQGDRRVPAMCKHGRLVITTEIAQAFFKRIIVIEGLEVALSVYKQLSGFFSVFNGWSGIAQAINKLLEQEVKRLEDGKIRNQRRGRKSQKQYHKRRQQPVFYMIPHVDQMIMANAGSIQHRGITYDDDRRDEIENAGVAE